MKGLDLLEEANLDISGSTTATPMGPVPRGPRLSSALPQSEMAGSFLKASTKKLLNFLYRVSANFGDWLCYTNSNALSQCKMLHT